MLAVLLSVMVSTLLADAEGDTELLLVLEGDTELLLALPPPPPPPPQALRPAARKIAIKVRDLKR